MAELISYGWKTCNVVSPKCLNTETTNVLVPQQQQQQQDERLSE